jgi:hypothetical protein
VTGSWLSPFGKYSALIERNLHLRALIFSFMEWRVVAGQGALGRLDPLQENAAMFHRRFMG